MSYNRSEGGGTAYGVPVGGRVGRGGGAVWGGLRSGGLLLLCCCCVVCLLGRWAGGWPTGGNGHRGRTDG